MTVHRYEHQGGPVYVVACHRCGAVHYPSELPRLASDARAAARAEGWYASHRTQERRPDLCPGCR
ncbi:hypothetical protein HNR23_002303 [Nocardiopsis mwathae]|uniref:Uncharacterized protein n=1 Tax=Nocardiopsis mwathae TaxID=1472723 RepID=A0A7W9YHJ5_9ACTN|nr:hypothetical protein [Nocardiopsis mwathae]